MMNGICVFENVPPFSLVPVLEASPEVVQGVFNVAVALVAFLGVFVTASVSIYTLKKESYNKRVTEERIKWLNKMRDLYGTMMAAWKMKIASENNYYPPNFNAGFYNEKMFEAEKAKAEFLTRLNTSAYATNQYNFQIKEVLSRLNFVKGFNAEEMKELQKGIDLMEFYVNKMLEQEWSRSKEETL